MKKLFTILMAGIISISMFTGCQDAQVQTPSSQPESSKPEVAPVKEPVKLTMWYETDEAIGAEFQKELDKLAPDVVVKVERKEKIIEALKLVGNDPANAPDLFFFAHDKAGVFAEMGILSPITDFISKEDMSDLIPMTINAATYKDVIYQLPTYFETLLFMYNKALMKEPPKTTDDLLAYAKANTKGGNYGFVEQHSTAYYATGWIHAYGGYVINEKAEPGLGMQETVDALTYHNQFVPFMPLDGDYNTMTTLFKEGKAHSTIGGPWLIPSVKESGIDVGLAPMPTVNATGKPIKPFSGVQGVYVIKGKDDKKDAITVALKQLSKPDIGISLAKVMGSAPANQKCYDNADVTSNEIVAALKVSAESVVPMPNVPEMDVMWAVTENLLTAVNKNNGVPKVEAEKAQKDALSQIEAMK